MELSLDKVIGAELLKYSPEKMVMITTSRSKKFRVRGINPGWSSSCEVFELVDDSQKLVALILANSFDAADRKNIKAKGLFSVLIDGNGSIGLVFDFFGSEMIFPGWLNEFCREHGSIVKAVDYRKSPCETIWDGALIKAK